MLTRWNWLRLVSFCLTRVLAASLALAVILAGGALALAHGQSSSRVPRRNLRNQGPSPYQPFTGVITDSKCGARHTGNGDLSSAECVRFCVRHGSQYVLVDGEKSFVLSGDTSQLSKLAGQRVKIMGTRTSDGIAVGAVLEQ